MMAGRKNKFKIPGLSFSWKRALGITTVKRRIAKATCIPTTRSGRQAKVGRLMGCSLYLYILLIAVIACVVLTTSAVAETKTQTQIVEMLQNMVKESWSASVNDAKWDITEQESGFQYHIFSMKLDATESSFDDVFSKIDAYGGGHEYVVQKTVDAAKGEAVYGETAAYESSTGKKKNCCYVIIENDSAFCITTTVPEDADVEDTLIASGKSVAVAETENSSLQYIGNKNTKKFHRINCSSVSDMKEKNKVEISTREEAVNAGYVPCKKCYP